MRVPRGALVAAGQWLGCALYLLVVIIAVTPPGMTLLGVAFSPLLAAGIGLSLLVTLGVLLAWGYFLDQRIPAEGKD